MIVMTMMMIITLTMTHFLFFQGITSHSTVERGEPPVTPPLSPRVRLRVNIKALLMDNSATTKTDNHQNMLKEIGSTHAVPARVRLSLELAAASISGLTISSP